MVNNAEVKTKMCEPNPSGSGGNWSASRRRHQLHLHEQLNRNTR